MNQLPQMNPYPAERSILVLDNCHIHHNDAIVELVHAAGKMTRSRKDNISDNPIGCLILYRPPYSPDLNPIEESFSKCKSSWL
jgi:transposase